MKMSQRGGRRTRFIGQAQNGLVQNGFGNDVIQSRTNGNNVSVTAQGQGMPQTTTLGQVSQVTPFEPFFLEDDEDGERAMVLNIDTNGDNDTDARVVVITQPQQQQPDSCTVPVEETTFQRDTQIITGPKTIVKVETDPCGNAYQYTEQVTKRSVTGPWYPVNAPSEIAGLPFGENQNGSYGIPGVRYVNSLGPVSTDTVNSNMPIVGKGRRGNVGRGGYGVYRGDTSSYTRGLMSSHRGV